MNKANYYSFRLLSLRQQLYKFRTNPSSANKHNSSVVSAAPPNVEKASKLHVKNEPYVYSSWDIAFVLDGKDHQDGDELNTTVKTSGQDGITPPFIIRVDLIKYPEKGMATKAADSMSVESFESDTFKKSGVATKPGVSIKSQKLNQPDTKIPVTSKPSEVSLKSGLLKASQEIIQKSYQPNKGGLSLYSNSSDISLKSELYKPLKKSKNELSETSKPSQVLMKTELPKPPQEVQVKESEVSIKSKAMDAISYISEHVTSPLKGIRKTISLLSLPSLGKRSYHSLSVTELSKKDENVDEDNEELSQSRSKDDPLDSMKVATIPKKKCFIYCTPRFAAVSNMKKEE